MGRSDRLAWGLIALGALLRVGLALANPVVNAFDDHVVPVSLTMIHGIVPKTACWQCYQPPVFYVLSAGLGKVLIAFGASFAVMIKGFQLLVCAYGVATLFVVRAILNRVPLSTLARLLALGTVCLLPRHVYMSAMHSNDTLVYLALAVCVYLLLRAIDDGFENRRWLLALCASVTFAVFTKYTAFVVLPAVLAAVGLSWLYGRIERRRALAALAVVLALPAALLALYTASNLRSYDHPMPANFEKFDPAQGHPLSPTGVSFVSFKPWRVLGLFLVPDNLDSYWTLVHARTWFDLEPKFLAFTRPGEWESWKGYFAWLYRKEPYAGAPPALSSQTWLIGRGLIVFGLLPLALVIGGGFLAVRGRWRAGEPASGDPASAVKAQMLCVLLAFNAVGLIALTLRTQGYSAMKAHYYLTSLPAFAVLLGIGVMACERIPALRRALLAGLGALFVLCSVHLVEMIVATLQYGAPVAGAGR